VDLLMTDLRMPTHGVDVARLAKAMHPRLPVVLVIGCAQTIPPISWSGRGLTRSGEAV
jgi:FixJ family two-component response regulator